MRNICQNLLFAFAYNAIGIPVVAALALSLSSVSVITNAQRLLAARLRANTERLGPYHQWARHMALSLIPARFNKAQSGDRR